MGRRTKNERTHRSIRLVTAAIILAAGCGPAQESARVFRQNRLLMGTIVEITVASDDEKKATAGMDAAFREMERLDNLLGCHEQNGEIHALNERGYPYGFTVSGEVYGLIRRAEGIGRETGGAFDITVGGLMKLWSFETGGRVPEGDELARTRRSVGWSKLAFDDAERKITFLVPGVSLDLGGIGEGYAVDRAYGILTGRGISSGIINAGGDLMVWGGKPDGSPWKVGIQHPRRTEELLGIVTVTDRAVVTSGDYEKCFTAAGKRYHHILDPATGYPAQGVVSVTVVADTAEVADAYATALVVMGSERAKKFLAGHPALQAVVVDGAGSVFATEGLKSAFSPP